MMTEIGNHSKRVLMGIILGWYYFLMYKLFHDEVVHPGTVTTLMDTFNWFGTWGTLVRAIRWSIVRRRSILGSRIHRFLRWRQRISEKYWNIGSTFLQVGPQTEWLTLIFLSIWLSFWALKATKAKTAAMARMANKIFLIFILFKLESVR